MAGTAAISIADMDTMHSAEIPFTRLLWKYSLRIMITYLLYRMQN